MQLEYYWYGVLTTFLFSLAIVLFIFTFLLKEYAIIFHVLYIFCVIIDFLTFKGVGKQFLWFEIDFLMNDRNYSFILGTLFSCLFSAHFYKYDSKTKIFKKIFKFAGYLVITLFIGSIINYFLLDNGSYTWISFSILKIISLVFSITHIVLAIKKTIPYYLGFAFATPLIIINLYQLLIPKIENGSELLYRFIFLNSPYIGFAIEIIFVTYFVVETLAKTRKRYEKLKRVNNNIKNNMESLVLETQLNERNRLLSNVHDSFGGSIEALRFRLNIDNSKENISDTLDQFYSQYRLLLKNLDDPKIHSGNLKMKMEDYLEDIQSIFPIEVKFTTNIETPFISKEKCTHFYFAFCELVTNAIKHAKATEIDISVNTLHKKLLLNVSDNGIGFTSSRKSGYGLKSILEKTKKLSGDFTVTNKPDQGAEINLILPI